MYNLVDLVVKGKQPDAIKEKQEELSANDALKKQGLPVDRQSGTKVSLKGIGDADYINQLAQVSPTPPPSSLHRKLSLRPNVHHVMGDMPQDPHEREVWEHIHTNAANHPLLKDAWKSGSLPKKQWEEVAKMIGVSRKADMPGSVSGFEHEKRAAAWEKFHKQSKEAANGNYSRLTPEELGWIDAAMNKHGGTASLHKGISNAHFMALSDEQARRLAPAPHGKLADVKLDKPTKKEQYLAALLHQHLLTHHLANKRQTWHPEEHGVGSLRGLYTLPRSEWGKLRNVLNNTAMNPAQLDREHGANVKAHIKGFKKTNISDEDLDKFNQIKEQLGQNLDTMSGKHSYNDADVNALLELHKRLTEPDSVIQPQLANAIGRGQFTAPSESEREAIRSDIGQVPVSDSESGLTKLAQDPSDATNLNPNNAISHWMNFHQAKAPTGDRINRYSVQNYLRNAPSPLMRSVGLLPYTTAIANMVENEFLGGRQSKEEGYSHSFVPDIVHLISAHSMLPNPQSQVRHSLTRYIEQHGGQLSDTDQKTLDDIIGGVNEAIERKGVKGGLWNKNASRYGMGNLARVQMENQEQAGKTKRTIGTGEGALRANARESAKKLFEGRTPHGLHQILVENSPEAKQAAEAIRSKFMQDVKPGEEGSEDSTRGIRYGKDSQLLKQYFDQAADEMPEADVHDLADHFRGKLAGLGAYDPQLAESLARWHHKESMLDPDKNISHVKDPDLAAVYGMNNKYQGGVKFNDILDAVGQAAIAHEGGKWINEKDDSQRQTESRVNAASRKIAQYNSILRSSKLTPADRSRVEKNIEDLHNYIKQQDEDTPISHDESPAQDLLRQLPPPNNLTPQERDQYMTAIENIANKIAPKAGVPRGRVKPIVAKKIEAEPVEQPVQKSIPTFNSVRERILYKKEQARQKHYTIEKALEEFMEENVNPLETYRKRIFKSTAREWIKKKLGMD